jgi:hypothetical protein
MKKLFIVLTILLFGFRLWQSTGCKNYAWFKFDPITVKIRVEEHVGLDESMPRQLSRFFHNKITTGVFEFAKAFAKPLETKNLISLLGPLGLVLLVSALGVARRTSPFIYRAHALILFATLLAATLLSNARITFYLIALLLYSFSIHGLKIFKNNKLSVTIFLSLFIFSLVYFNLDWQMAEICNEIFFN